MSKRKILTLLIALILLFGTFVYAGEVDVKISSTVARNFFYEQVAASRNLEYGRIMIKEHFSVPNEAQADYRVFNFIEGGWVIVSADDITVPILAYGVEGEYIPGHGSPSHLAWMDQYRQEIAWHRANTVQDISTQGFWSRYMTADPGTLNRPEGARDTEPLLQSKWGQGKYYNALCPADPSGDDGHALVGCVATSLSQVMYYYRHPAQGAGSYGYNANNAAQGYGDYGYLFVNFANATYGWDGMNNSLNGNNSNLSVAELCYHAGVSVSMAFGPTKSGSQTQYTVPALKNYFGYSSSVSYLQRLQYSTTNWENIIKANLDTKKPIIYGGIQPSPGGGHAWNIDGYQTTANGLMFHCNWGWDGMSDGYFSINNLAPGTEPPFQNNQGAVVNIYPAGSYPPSCGSTKDVSHRAGSIDDGSGPMMNYADNLDCFWLIHPEDSIGRITLNFPVFNVADDGDIITVYDGPTTSDAVLGTFSFSTPPQQVMSTGSRMLVRWTTNGSGNASGWHAAYTSTNPGFCINNAQVGAASGNLSDGSGSAKYSNNTTCSWLINPVGGKNLTITFTSFDIASGDYINVYDWGTQTLLLNKATGTNIPPAVVATSGAAYIEFKTDWAFSGQGWEATYTVGNVGIEDPSWKQSLNVFPVPASDVLTLEMQIEHPESLAISLMDITGRVINTNIIEANRGNITYSIDTQKLTAGIYLLKVAGESTSTSRKVIIQ